MLESQLRWFLVVIFDEYAVYCACAVDAEEVGVFGVYGIRTASDRFADRSLFAETIFDEEIISGVQNGIYGREGRTKITVKVLHQKARPLELSRRFRRLFKPRLAISVDELDPRVGNLAGVLVH